MQAAADTAARVLLPRAAELDAVVLGGDATALRSLAADLRLTALLERAEPACSTSPNHATQLDEAARCADVQLRP